MMTVSLFWTNSTCHDGPCLYHPNYNTHIDITWLYSSTTEVGISPTPTPVARATLWWIIHFDESSNNLLLTSPRPHNIKVQEQTRLWLLAYKTIARPITCRFTIILKGLKKKYIFDLINFSSKSSTLMKNDVIHFLYVQVL